MYTETGRMTSSRAGEEEGRERDISGRSFASLESGRMPLMHGG